MNLTEPIRNIEDIKRIEDNLKPVYRLIFKIGVQIGLRVSDILNLNTDIVGKSQLTIKEKKTGKTKIFPLSETLQNDILKYYLDIRQQQYAIKDNDKNAFFITQQHNRYDRSSIWKAFNKAAKKLNIGVTIGTHSMRKTFGYHHYKQYGDIVLLQAILNHSSPSITLRYIGVTQDEINSSYKNFCLSKNIPEIITDKKNDLRINQANSTTRKIIKEEIVKMEENIIKTIIENFDYIFKIQNKKLDRLLGVNK